MKIFFDNKEIDIDDSHNNLVDALQQAKIHIIAPCYRKNTCGGCCQACVVLVDGKQSYACATKPYDNINITYNTPELIELRMERVKQYANSTHNNSDDNVCDCNCNCGCS